MTLKEAIESGKRFKRRHWLEWTTHTHTSSYGAEQITSDDWVVEEPAKQKVTMWQGIFKLEGYLRLSNVLYKNENEARIDMGSSFVKLVNPIEIEVEL